MRTPDNDLKFETYNADFLSYWYSATFLWARAGGMETADHKPLIKELSFFDWAPTIFCLVTTIVVLFSTPIACRDVLKYLMGHRDGD